MQSANMTLPEPEAPLVDACSTMFNNTLYTYMHDAFQALPLTHGAEWSMLPMGEAVKGGVCVKTTPKNDTSAAALYIVGGTSNSSTYQGLQRFTFANQSWETIEPSVAVTQGRLYHNAVYLNTSDSILVFSGTQDGTQQESSQTFTIQATWPFTVTAYPAIAPPAINPILLQWSESKAIYVGGSSTNKQAMIFSPSLSWVDSNATLAVPIYDTSAVKAVVINGDDSSKTLYTFDPTTSPNSVNRTVLIDADGNPVQNAAAVNERDAPMQEKTNYVKRDDLTLADWPTYNDTLVPTSTRGAYAIARDQSGLVVITGGNEDDVLCMFRARKNTWVNASLALSEKGVSQQGLGELSVPSSSATATSATATSSSTDTATATSAASNKPSDSAFPIKILGAVLGSILGIAFFILAFLILFRWRKKRKQHQEAGHNRRSSGLPNDEKDPMDFQDRGSPNSMVLASPPPLRGHGQQASQGSVSSMAILMGQFNQDRYDEKNNPAMNNPYSNDNFKPAATNAMPQTIANLPPAHEASRDERGISFAAEKSNPPVRARPSKSGQGGNGRRSSGWNGYWSGGSGLSMLGLGAGKRTTYGSEHSMDSESEYSDTRRLATPSSITQKSALVPPLKIGDRPFELSRVMSGSPTIENHPNHLALPKEMSGSIERSNSVSSVGSHDEDLRDAFSSWIPESVDGGRDSRLPNDGQGWARNYPPSNYSESVYATTVAGRDTAHFPTQNRNTNFPGRPMYPPQVSNSARANYEAAHYDLAPLAAPVFPGHKRTDTAGTTNTLFPGEPLYSSDALEFPRNPFNAPENVAPVIASPLTPTFPPNTRTTAFPGQPLHQNSPIRQPQAGQNGADMSWLNLGGASRI